MVANVAEPVYRVSDKSQMPCLLGEEGLPVDLACILEEAQRNTVHRSIAPSLVEEPTSPIQMIEIILVCLAAPEAQIRNLKIAPEVTGAVPIRLYVVLWPARAVGQPIHRIILVQALRVLCHKLHRLRPQRGDGVRRVVQVDGEPVGLVVILHVSEDIVVNVAEEVYVGLHPPIILHVFECWVLVEEPAVPSAHLVVRHHAAVLDVLFFEDLD